MRLRKLGIGKMSGLLFLSNDDFSIAKGTKGNIMVHSIPGFSVVLFYSNHCPHCQNLIPLFKTLPGTIAGCQFGMMNISKNKACAIKSKETISPILFVPLILFYVSGKPYMRYTGPYDINEIKRFIVEVAHKYNQQKSYFDAQKHALIKAENKKIPGYAIGHPLYGQEDDVTYLKFEEAYIKS